MSNIAKTRISSLFSLLFFLDQIWHFNFSIFRIFVTFFCINLCFLPSPLLIFIFWNMRLVVWLLHGKWFCWKCFYHLPFWLILLVQSIAGVTNFRPSCSSNRPLEFKQQTPSCKLILQITRLDLPAGLRKQKKKKAARKKWQKSVFAQKWIVSCIAVLEHRKHNQVSTPKNNEILA